MPRRRAVRVLKHGSLWIYRLALYALLAGVAATATCMLAARYWLLPNIDQYRETISAAVSRAVHQRVVIGSIQGDWRGLRPRLVLRDVRLYDPAGTERLVLDAVDSTLSWATLVALEPRFHEIALSGLAFEVRRDASGMLHVAGIALGGGDGGGLADWLLEQSRIVLRDSEITWVDETLGGARLELKQVQLEVDKLFRRHRFGLRAVPPLELAAPLDLRGDLHIATLSDFREWEGRLFFQIGYADLAALRQWVQMPLEIERGAGGMQVWMDVAGGRLRSITADLGLSDVRTRLRADLPPLELEQLRGRLGWTARPGMLEVSARDLTFSTPDGLGLAPADVRYRRTGAPGDARARYDVEFDALDLAAATRLIDRLPVDETLRARLAQLQPHGTVRGFRVSWRGSIKDGGEYSVRGGFDNLAVSPSGYLPGFASVTGSVDADERGGSLLLRAGESRLDMPRVFLEPLPLDSLTAKVAWSVAKGQPLVRLETVTFSNAHLEGRVAGTYQAQAEGPGLIDLAGALTRADGREAWRYIPLVVNQDVRDWLRASIRSGQAAEVRVALRGELERFPFSDGSGVFEVVSKLEGGTLEFAPGWPAVDGIRGQVAVRSHLMTIQADEARVFGVRLFGVRAAIPDLGAAEPILQVIGEGEGPTADFLRYVEESPVDKRIDGFARGLQVSGSGGLRLMLDVPLTHVVDTRVSGRYRFADHVVVAAGGGPRLEQLGGVLVFSQDDVTVREGTVRLFGMPTRFTAERRPGTGVVIRGGGRADIAALSRELDLPGAGYLSGSTDWKATVSLVGRSYELVAESDLRGVASSLPAPLAKKPASALPLRVERRPRGPDEEVLAFSLGEILAGQLARGRDGSGRIMQGELRLGQPAPAPQRDGVWLAGQLEHLDLDAWRAVMNGGRGAANSSALAGVDLRVANLYVFSRNWKDLVVEARHGGDAWQATLAGRQAVGMLTWTSGGQGNLTGRFSRLHVPAVGSVLQEAPRVGVHGELPSVNVVAEDFRMGERQLGRLALAAVPQGPDWRIERLDLRSPEGRLAMSGVWQMWNASPLTRLNVRLEVTDIGRYFARLQMPEGLKGGSGKLEGQLSWSGPPYALDLPSLSGKLALEARNGQFVRVEPGIGKLIGVVSLQALPRRVTLDFRDVFSQGFPFDEIRSSAAIDRGVLRTDDFHMVGTSARVDMKGQLDLARETQKLDVKVLPSLSEGVALGAAIVNPAVGLATLFAQKALKDPINQMAAFEYEITGTWADPLVAAKKREPAADAKQGRK